MMVIKRRMMMLSAMKMTIMRWMRLATTLMVRVVMMMVTVLTVGMACGVRDKLGLGAELR